MILTSVQKVVETASAAPMLHPLVPWFYGSSTGRVQTAPALFANC
jgi:hypothetical protein